MEIDGRLIRKKRNDEMRRLRKEWDLPDNVINIHEDGAKELLF